MGGYQQLLNVLLDQGGGAGALARVPICKSTVVRRIQWREGTVNIEAQSPHGTVSFAAPRVIVTVPVGVLQAEHDFRFDPPLPQPNLRALDHLVMGKGLRVTLCFREAPWAHVGRTRPERESKGLLSAESSASGDLSDLSFLFSHDEYFPTWWTQMPEHRPIITGWSPAHCAERMAGMTDGGIVDKSVESLANLLALDKALLNTQLNAAYLHNWDTDPFSRGAYSYVKVGGEGCQAALATPVANTLFFAGEHTHASGHNGTVHGAIASGQRAAREILKAGV